MSRWLAGAFAFVCVVGSAVAVWLVVVNRSPTTAAARPPRSRRPSREEAEAEAPAKPKAVKFTVSVSGDLLMHQPLLDQALANGGGNGYDFAPFFEPDRPYWIEERRLGLCHLETPMGPVPSTTYPIFNTPSDLAGSVKRSGWDACSTASNHSVDGGQAGIDGTVKALNHAGVDTPACSGRARRATGRRSSTSRGQGRVRRLHRRDQWASPTPPVVGERLRGRRSEGRGQADHQGRPQGARRGRRRGDRSDPLGRRVLAAQQLAVGRRQEAHRRQGRERRRRPGPARGPADPAHQRQVRRLQRGQPRLQPKQRFRPPRRHPGRADRPAAFPRGRRPRRGAPGYLCALRRCGSATTSSSPRAAGRTTARSASSAGATASGRSNPPRLRSRRGRGTELPGEGSRGRGRERVRCHPDAAHSQAVPAVHRRRIAGELPLWTLGRALLVEGEEPEEEGRPDA